MAQENWTPKNNDRRVGHDEERRSYHDRRSDMQELIDARLQLLEKRRDDNLSDKLELFEKLFNLIVSTKAEATSIAISRIQGDSKDCLQRCTKQVGVFYDIINDLRARSDRRQIEIEFILKALDDHKLDGTVSSGESEEAVNKLKDRLVIIEDWKTYFWWKNLPIISVFITSVVIGAWQFFEWLHKAHSIFDKYP